MDRADFPLLYKKKHCLCINDITHSLYYYFDYDERSQKVNMEFQHSHPFYEIMVYLGPQQASHLIEGIPYSLCPGDFVFLRPSILHRSDYSNIQPSKRLIINFLYPPSLWDNPAPYEKLFTPFHSMVPIYRFPVQKQIRACGRKVGLLRIVTNDEIHKRTNSDCITTAGFYRFSKKGYRTSWLSL